MRHSESLTKLAPALVAARAGFHVIRKDSTNPHFKSKFASYEAIVSAVRPALTANGLSILQSGGLPSPESTVIEVETMLLHESGEFICNTVWMPMTKRDPQAAGSAITYGRRYGLSAVLSLATDEDDDGNGATEPEQAAPPKPAERPATEEQSALLANLLKSHVFSDAEREKVGGVTGKARTAKAIDWAKGEIVSRKAAEKAAG